MERRYETGFSQRFKGRSKAFEEDKKEFLSKLKDFPHLFQLDYSELTHARIKSIHDRLRREQNDPFKSTAGDIRDLNFTAFLLFLINDIDDAIQLTETVLKTTEGGNLVALGNMAVMLWLKRNRADGEKYAERLQNLKETCEKSEFEANVARGKAEIAYCYSRMGMAFAARAVDVFEEVVHQIPEEYSWKFGLALVLRRFTHLNYRVYYQVTAKTSREQNMKAFELLQEITNCASVPDLKAHAWAELGMLLGQPSLRWDQEYVKDAECHFLKAIEISHGENTTARFDLGLMYFALGECQLALEQFSSITSQDECCLSPLQFINAYEQSGLVYLMLSSNAKDEPEKEKHLSVARTMLHRALEMQCDLVKELPKCLPDVKYIWSSFHTLCRAAQDFEIVALSSKSRKSNEDDR
ncbi:hypothetical protein C0Q70_02851 [Pomacea canaliculata]|uniref:Uncharacterized protein n=1 Tax=Pomacea canaliculata TaxID=400727 RepID=A0A2T7PR28_POMCA|nr:hypothetical protein C0Q70_02851 [Pomacea canaliculata]